MKVSNAVLIKENRKIKKLLEIGKILRTFLLIGTVFVIVIPFVRILVDALKSSADLSNPLVYWIPVELEEQAQLDGAGVIQTFWRVMLPNVKGAVMTVGIFTFVLTYNDSYYPMMFNFDMQNFELLSTKLVTGRYANVNAVALLIILPLLVLYIITQNIFIRGIENTVSNNQY